MTDISPTLIHIKQVFLDLLQDKSLEDLTVSFLCQEAHISRSTFYFYFEDKYALYSDIKEESISKLLEGIKPKLSSLENLSNHDYLDFLKNYSQAFYQVKDQLSLLLRADNTLSLEIEERIYLCIIRAAADLTGSSLNDDYKFFIRYISGAIWSSSMEEILQNKYTEQNFFELLCQVNLSPMKKANSLLN